MLFSDLALKDGSILPNYDVLIFDEAHTMAEVASEHLGVEMTEYSVEYLLTRLYNDRTNKGLLVEELDQTRGGPLAEPFQIASEHVVDCSIRADSFFDSLREWLDARPHSNGRVLEPHIVDNGLGEGLRALKRSLSVAADVVEDEGRRQEYLAAAPLSTVGLNRARKEPRTGLKAIRLAEDRVSRFAPRQLTSPRFCAKISSTRYPSS